MSPPEHGTGYEDYLGEGKLNGRIDVDELVEKIGLNEEEIAWRKEFINFSEDDIERLGRFEEPFETHNEEIADSFYNHLTDFKETRAVIGRSPKDIEHLKLTQAAYLTTLADDEYGTEYFHNRARIGKLHDILDMPMKHYIGQYNVYYGLLLSLITDRIQNRLSTTVDRELSAENIDRDSEIDPKAFARQLYADVEKGIDELHSILKVLNLDMQVAIDTYLQSHLDNLQAERDRFAALFENVPTPVVAVQVKEGNTEVKEVNPAFEEVFGYSAADLEGEPLEEYLRPPEKESTPVRERATVDDIESASDAELTEAEVTLETKFGHREFIRVSAPIERSGTEWLEYAFYMDVTDQKQRQERLQVLSRVLRHDIRTEMNLVKGCASTLRDADDLDKHLLDEIETASENLLSMSNKIRGIERLVASDVERQPVNAIERTKKIIRDIQECYPECDFALSASDPGWVTATESVRVAIENVVENAAEHNDAAEPEVDISIVESLDGEHVDIRVADNGSGIPPSEYEILTGMRERSQTDHTSGLGLWTVNWIVTRLGGTLQFDANMPRGSIVTLRLPKVASPETL